MTSHLPQERPLDQRAVAWRAAKLAVRSYARDPSSRNAGEVQQAWARVRHVMAESARLWMERQPPTSTAGMPQG